MPQKTRRTFTPEQKAVDRRSCVCGSVHCEAVKQTRQPSGPGNGIDLRTERVLTALSAALGHRQPAKSGLLFHSDWGSQSVSHDDQQALAQANITCSLSRSGNCWDNAVVERFFGTLKTELIHPTVFPNRAIAKTTIVEWIEFFYNRKRLHSTLGFLPPAQFEEKYDFALQPPVPA